MLAAQDRMGLSTFLPLAPFVFPRLPQPSYRRNTDSSRPMLAFELPIERI